MCMNQEYEYTDRILELLEKKHAVIHALIEAMKVQIICFEDHDFDEERYNRIEEKKDEYIRRMEDYNEEQEELMVKAEEELKQLIQIHHEKSKILQQKTEELNQMSMIYRQIESQLREVVKQYISEERKKIQEIQNQRSSAATYFKNMNGVAQAGYGVYDLKR